MKKYTDEVEVEFDSEGNQFHYNKKGQLHREDGPAVHYASGKKVWFLKGVSYSEKQFLAKMNLPVIDDKGNKFWYNEDGKYHRLDGPAVIWNDGSKTWYKNGLCHREDGPAVECVIDGPAWYLNGNYLTKTQFMDIKNKDKVVKMTMAEINKMAGCIVKIVESH